MKIRKLEKKDTLNMFNWMHDIETVKYFNIDFSKKTIEDCEKFIENSFTDTNINFAIVDDNDNYLGTITLKNIDKQNKNAEYAIVVDSKYHGKGVSNFATKEILKYAFETLKLNVVYLCVSPENKRAISFYKKTNFHEMVDIPINLVERYDSLNLKWYVIYNDNVIKEDVDSVIGLRIVRIKTISTINAGQISFFEADKDVPFPIKRIYYISKVPEGARRGFHAHKKLKQLIFCPYGKITMYLENELGKTEVIMKDPSVAILIDKPTWREMKWEVEGSVLCVATNEYYDENDYIRNYDEFKKYIGVE